jgi:hypothetical protein
MSAREAGPVITLSGEVDINTVAELSELISGQLADERLQLTVDVAGLAGSGQRARGIAGCSPKKRMNSALASGPRASV